MAKQFAVLHIKKGKSSGGGLGNHIDRKEGMEHTYPHADSNRKLLNQEFANSKYSSLSIPEAVKLRIEEGYKKPTKIRKDAVKYLNTILSGSHEQMTEISKDKTLLNKWIKKNLEFSQDEFGEKNIIRFTLHLDEKTPHIHVVHVPITHEGGLSARQYIGSRTKLSQIQDRYAEKMQEFGLNRGIRNTGIKHNTAKEYYRTVKITENEVQNLEVKGVFGIKKDETIDLLKNTLKTQILDSKIKKSKEYQKLNQVKRDLKYMKHYRASAEKRLADSKKIIQNKNEILKYVLESPENVKKYKNYLLRKQEEIRQEKIRKKGRGFSM